MPTFRCLWDISSYIKETFTLLNYWCNSKKAQKQYNYPKFHPKMHINVSCRISRPLLFIMCPFVAARSPGWEPLDKPPHCTVCEAQAPHQPVKTVKQQLIHWSIMKSNNEIITGGILLQQKQVDTLSRFYFCTFTKCIGTFTSVKPLNTCPTLGEHRSSTANNISNETEMGKYHVM